MGGPGCGARGRWQGLAGLRTPSVHQVPPVWRALEGPEGTGGLRDGCQHAQHRRRRRRVGRRRVRRARLPCPWAMAGPGRASNTISTPGAAGVEGARGSGGPGCRARGRWQGLAGLRGDAPSEARGADGSRAGRRPRRSQAPRPGPTAPGTPAARRSDNSPGHTKTDIRIGCRSVVELGGFEPPTFSLRTRRATNCAIAPRTHTA